MDRWSITAYGSARKEGHHVCRALGGSAMFGGLACEALILCKNEIFAIINHNIIF